MTGGRPVRDVVGVAIAVIVAGVCVRLGMWQLRRREERRAIVERLLAVRALPPVEVATAQIPADSVRDRRVHLRGTFDYSRERVWPGRSYQDVPGVALITPLRLPDGSGVLVDRGFAPAADAWHVRFDLFRDPDSADVAGLALPAPRGRGDVDPARLGDSFPYPVARWVVLELEHQGQGSPRVFRWRAEPLDLGPHLLYAIQWFSFATITIVGTFFLLRRTAGERHS